jgi:hypothetical protein
MKGKAVILFVVVMAAILATTLLLVEKAPLFKCPSCLGYKTQASHDSSRVNGVGTEPVITLVKCFFCEGYGRVSLFKKYLQARRATLGFTVIGFADPKQVPPQSILAIFEKAGIEGGPGPGSMIYEVVVLGGQVSAAIDVLEGSSLKGLHLHRTSIQSEEK